MMAVDPSCVRSEAEISLKTTYKHVRDASFTFRSKRMFVQSERGGRREGMQKGRGQERGGMGEGMQRGRGQERDGMLWDMTIRDEKVGE